MNIIRIRNNNLNDNTLLYRGTNPRQQTNKQKLRNPSDDDEGRKIERQTVAGGDRVRLLGSVIADDGGGRRS